MTIASARCNGCPLGYSNGFYPSDSHARWLKVCKICTHLVSAAFLCPRLDGSVIRVDQHQVELFLHALHNIRFTLSDLSLREATSTSWHRGKGNSTHYIVSHQMAPRGHPCSHLGYLDELAQLRVLQHQISAYDRAVHRVSHQEKPPQHSEH